MSTITIHRCDICKEQTTKDQTDKQLPVIFVTEQTEGRNCAPHLYTSKLDLCKKCEDWMLAGHFIFANGAQGHTEYFFKEKP